MAKRYIFLYVPNIIGYIRLILVAVSYFYISSDPKLFLILYCASMILDGFDGIAARMLDQVTTFGAWFDVVIDNFSRGMLWSHINQWGWIISCLEWLVFVCTHTLGKQWKDFEYATPPVWVRAIMANGFKTPIGAFVILGLDVLPIWIYLQKNEFLGYAVTECVQAYLLIGLIIGRLLCMTVEAWFIFNHITAMAAYDQREQPHDDNDAGDDDYDDYDAADGDNENDVYNDELDDDFSKDMKPIPPSSKGVKITRRQKGPSSNPTPGSTMINMGLSTRRRVSASKPPSERKGHAQGSKRRSIPADRDFQGPYKESPGHPRERSRTRPPGSRGSRITEDMREKMSPDNDRRRPIPRRPGTDDRLRKSANTYHRKESKRNPNENRSPEGRSAQRRGARPSARRAPPRVPDHERALPSIVVNQEQLPGAMTDVHQKTQGGKQVIDEPFEDAKETLDIIKEDIQENEETFAEATENHKRETHPTLLKISESKNSNKQLPKLHTLIPTFQTVGDDEDVDQIYQNNEEQSLNTLEVRRGIFEWIGESRVKIKPTRGKKDDVQEVYEDTPAEIQPKITDRNLSRQLSNVQQPIKQQEKIQSLFDWLGGLVKLKSDNAIDACESNQEKTSLQSKTPTCSNQEETSPSGQILLPELTVKQQQKQQSLIPTFQDLEQADVDEEVNQDYQNEEPYSSSQREKRQSIFEWIGETRVTTNLFVDAQDGSEEQDLLPDGTYSKEQIKSKPTLSGESLKRIVSDQPPTAEQVKSAPTVSREGLEKIVSDQPPTLEDQQQLPDGEGIRQSFHENKSQSIVQESGANKSEKRQSIFQWLGAFVNPKPSNEEAHEHSLDKRQSKSSTCSREGVSLSGQALPQLPDKQQQKRKSLIPTFQDLTQADGDERVNQDYQNEEPYSSSQREKRQSIFEWIGETRVTTNLFVDALDGSGEQDLLPDDTSSVMPLSPSRERASSLQQSDKQNQNLKSLEDPGHLHQESSANQKEKVSNIDVEQISNVREIKDMSDKEDVFEDSVENFTDIKEDSFTKGYVKTIVEMLEDSQNRTSTKEDLNYYDDILEDTVGNLTNLNENGNYNENDFEDIVESPVTKGYVQAVVNKLQSPKETTTNFDMENNEETCEYVTNQGEPSTSFKAIPRKGKEKKKVFKWMTNRSKKQAKAERDESLSDLKTESGSALLSRPLNSPGPRSIESVRNG